MKIIKKNKNEKNLLTQILIREKHKMYTPMWVLAVGSPSGNEGGCQPSQKRRAVKKHVERVGYEAQTCD